MRLWYLNHLEGRICGFPVLGGGRIILNWPLDDRDRDAVPLSETDGLSDHSSMMVTRMRLASPFAGVEEIWETRRRSSSGEQNLGAASQWFIPSCSHVVPVAITHSMKSVQSILVFPNDATGANRPRRGSCLLVSARW